MRKIMYYYLPIKARQGANSTLYIIWICDDGSPSKLTGFYHQSSTHCFFSFTHTVSSQLSSSHLE